MSIYEQWGLQPIINASGSVTRLGGAPMPPEVLDAFREAAGDCVPLDELQAAASRVIAKATGAESGLVVAGAAAGLMLGAAAILTRLNVPRMEQLPSCDTFAHRFVVAREHRNGYDHAVRAAGVQFVEVGFQEVIAGAGVRQVEAWEYEAAIDGGTAGVFYVHGRESHPPLDQVVAAAHRHQVPVLVDAAGELPPRSNLRDIIATGADLVAFSGGKAIRGPQATGILCGRRELIAAAALQMLDLDDHFELWNPPADFIDKDKLSGFPRHGIGRALKVSKEQIAALLTALQLFEHGHYDSQLDAMRGRLEQIVTMLEGSPVHTRIRSTPDAQSLPTLEIIIDQEKLGRSALEVCRRLRKGQPSIYVGHGMLAQGKLVIHPLHLNDASTPILSRRLREELDGS
jgi:D-glucosaminate-6-phosphate ammonia-lyase